MIVEQPDGHPPRKPSDLGDHARMTPATEQYHAAVLVHALILERHSSPDVGSAHSVVVLNSPMEPIRVGHVGYLNARPLVEGLDQAEHLKLVSAVPADLVGMLTSGDVDLALVSTADLVRSPVPLAVLHEGMIGSCGPTLTVKLLSSVPLEHLTTVHADVESHTSVALCKLLLAERTACDITFEPFRIDGITWPQAVLMIGDKVINTPLPESRYPYHLDLGEAWFDLTGLPMVYAAWACQTQRCEEEPINLARAMLDHQRRHNATRLPLIALRHATSHRWDTPTAITYFTRHMRYDLDEHAAQGLTEFIARGALNGVLPDAPLHWAEPIVCAHGQTKA